MRLCRSRMKLLFPQQKNSAQEEELQSAFPVGAAMYAALQLAKRDVFAGKRIVVLLPDTAERYLSTVLFED